jgi:glyoxylase-like metal-dependent hydrolase (beta-lactamase superfamily II)
LRRHHNRARSQRRKKNLTTYQSSPLPASPSITYDKDHVVRLGGTEVQIHHYGRSHTSGDSIVYYPDLKVVALSDAVTVGATGPLIDYPGGGSALEWQQVLETVLTLDVDAAIPGNGPVLTKPTCRRSRRNSTPSSIARRG